MYRKSMKSFVIMGGKFCILHQRLQSNYVFDIKMIYVCKKKISVVERRKTLISLLSENVIFRFVNSEDK